MVIRGARDVDSVEEGSVVVRGIPELGDSIIGAGMFDELSCLECVGSVTLREAVGGAVATEDPKAVLLGDGLSPFALKAALLGELGLDDDGGCMFTLLRKCCLSSTALRCWLSDIRLRGLSVLLPDVAGRSLKSCADRAPCLVEDTDRGSGRWARRPDLELPWLEDLACRV